MKTMPQPFFLSALVLMLLIWIGAESASAQCSMCKAVVESNSSAGGNVGKGINDGIVYLMGVPYILIATAGYFVYRNLKKNNSAPVE